MRRSVVIGLVLLLAVLSFTGGWIRAGSARRATESAEWAPVVRQDRDRGPVRIPGRDGPPIIRPGEEPPPVGEQWKLDLVSLKCRKTWYGPWIGGRDAVVLNLMAYDLATESYQHVTMSFICKHNTIYPLDLTTLWGPDRLKSSLRIIGSFTVSHPQNFRNIRDAMRKYAEAQGVALTTIGVATGDPGVALVGKVVSEEAVRNMIADILTESGLAVLKVVCSGAATQWSTPIDMTWSPIDLKPHLNKEFKLWYEVQGAKRKTCFRDIKYDLMARLLKVN